jgi:uncharacterized protein YrrD
MIEDYDGLDVIDTEGEKIGTTERTYDDSYGRPHLIEVKMGAILRKHRLVPVADAQRVQDGLRVPYTKSTVENSPDASDVDTSLSGELLEAVRSYYAESPVPAETGNAEAPL